MAHMPSSASSARRVKTPRSAMMWCTFAPRSPRPTRDDDRTTASVRSVRRTNKRICMSSLKRNIGGAGGSGTSTWAKLPPPTLMSDRALTLADGSLFHILTQGQGNMASYAAQLSPQDRWRVVLWVRQPRILHNLGVLALALLLMVTGGISPTPSRPI